MGSVVQFGKLALILIKMVYKN